MHAVANCNSVNFAQVCYSRFLPRKKISFFFFLFFFFYLLGDSRFSRRSIFKSNQYVNK